MGEGYWASYYIEGNSLPSAEMGRGSIRFFAGFWDVAFYGEEWGVVCSGRIS